MNDEERFCPICRAYHDPNFMCADRAGAMLHAVGIDREPMDKKELKKTVKEANRSMIIFAVVVLGLIMLTVLLGEIISSIK